MGPPLHCLMGPTAAGKTGLALWLAERFPIEIVSVDSAQVYRGMDIGTAKPDPALRARLPHHLIDLRDPAEAYSAAEFRADALAAIRDIRRRGRLPLLVGGTRLYFLALLEGLSDLPPADPELRARLTAEAGELGWPALHRRLAAGDARTAARLHPNDGQRIQRALEVLELTGRPLSLWTGSTLPSPGAAAREWIVAPADRARLHQQIAGRFQQMLAAGLVEEVEKLRRRPDLDLQCAAMRAVGYRQVWQHLEGCFPREAMVERAVAATRQFAKRQFSWLRGRPAAVWLPAERYQETRERLARALAAELNAAGRAAGGGAQGLW